MSAHCDGTRATCSWGGCLECDRIDRVFVNEIGDTVRVQVRKAHAGWLYRIELADGVSFHVCGGVDDHGNPECGWVNEQAALLLQ